MRGQDPQTRVLYEMWSMIVNLIRAPVSQRPQISPVAFGLLFIGISTALMMFGIVTFVIGFFLMPLVIMLVVLFYFAEIVARLSEIARSILWPGWDPNKVAAVWNYSN